LVSPTEGNECSLYIKRANTTLSQN
jgi:hypothetical protein